MGTNLLVLFASLKQFVKKEHSKLNSTYIVTEKRKKGIFQWKDLMGGYFLRVFETEYLKVQAIYRVL